MSITASVVKIAIHGAAGRMGKRLVALAAGEPALKIVAALERPDHPSLGEDAGHVAGIGQLGVLLASDLPAETSVDALIDFSNPEGAQRAVAICRRRRIPLVMATTGLTSDTQHHLRQLAEEVAVVWAPNMSLAVNVAMKLAEQAAAALREMPSGVDVEIIERHHRFKHDAPSGTALKFGERIAAHMGQTRHQHGRHGMVGQRPLEEIGYHAVRVGDNPGEHTVVFGMLGETLEITVKATNRDCYALGALQAARFAAGRPPGLYSMYDVLGLS
ncbi:MAG: 4-hydroxy-tetrahydrodipicolinate reductase [Pirellulaceae bacterium]|nr:MAG: 4-hydroxy-tetrahydrodipicolinate reductase [Pirellulaceae bacterium]